MKNSQQNSSETSENLFKLQHHTNADFNYPVHKHQDLEITLVEGCDGSRIVGDSVENFQYDDLVFINSNLQHKWIKKEGDKAPAVTTIQFKKEVFSSNFLNTNELNAIRKLLNCSDRGICFQGIDKYRIKLVINELIKATEFRRVLLFFEMLHIMAVSQEKEFLTPEGFLDIYKKGNSEKVNVVIDYIHNHFDKDISLNKVARLINMSDSAFSHFFRRQTGKVFSKFVNEVRLAKATLFLTTSEKTIADICYDCGFNNLSNFNRQFKKIKGISPSEYRKQFGEHKLVFFPEKGGMTT